MKLRIHNETGVRVPATRINRLFERVVGEEAPPRAAGQVNLVFTDDNHVRRLNREFRSRDKATDVLSFNIDEPESPSAVFGEIYISVPFAHQQAENYGGTLDEELLRLFCHGLLHLFGYDHQSNSDLKVMEQRHKHFLNGFRTTKGASC